MFTDSGILTTRVASFHSNLGRSRQSISNQVHDKQMARGPIKPFSIRPQSITSEPTFSGPQSITSEPIFAQNPPPLPERVTLPTKSLQDGRLLEPSESHGKLPRRGPGVDVRIPKQADLALRCSLFVPLPRCPCSLDLPRSWQVIHVLTSSTTAARSENASNFCRSNRTARQTGQSARLYLPDRAGGCGFLGPGPRRGPAAAPLSNTPARTRSARHACADNQLPRSRPPLR